MPDPTALDGATSLPQRFDVLARTVEGIVLRGIEHPACELKRTVTLSKDDLTDRLDFIKLIQGLANSHAGTECLIVIGADQKEKKFYDVSNADDFDPARMSPILAKYLSPEPKYEVFNDMRVSTGERYVLIVLNQVQPRPIVTLVDGKTETKVHFRPGEICIKHNTGLKLATRPDLDLMYEPKIELEAAKRARIIFEHLKADLGPELLSQAVTSTPVPELLVGSRERLARFAEAIISSADPSRYKMLIEMARQTIVEKWNPFLQGSRSSYGVSEQEKTQIQEFYNNEFIPTLISVVDLGLQIIRYDGPSDWLGYVIHLLVESFHISSQVDHLQAINEAGDAAVPFARPAYECYLGGRTIATYALARKRLHLTKEILPCYVKPLAPRRYEDSLEPFLFWPFSGQLGLPEMRNGRNEEYWQQRIGETWGDVFGSEDEFSKAAAQLEFILELNSHLLVQYSSPATNKFREDFPEKRTAYIPDFWKNPLGPAVPMASLIFESLMGDKGFPIDLAIEPGLTTAVFKGMSAQGRELFYGEFLFNLKKWQDQAMSQQQRFPFRIAWPPRLQRAVDLFKTSQALNPAQGRTL
jgi:hypothetical protein